MSWIEAFEQTSAAHRLVVFAAIKTEQALNHNPGVAERRRLNSSLVELDLMRAKLDSALLFDARLLNTRLRDATLDNARLDATRLDGVDLRSARLTNTRSAAASWARL